MIEQLEYRTGQTDYLGQMLTWVSGESAATATIVGQWSDVIGIWADRGISRISADRTATAVHADRELIEVRG